MVVGLANCQINFCVYIDLIDANNANNANNARDYNIETFRIYCIQNERENVTACMVG
jgi:hypothetical protein